MKQYKRLCSLLLSLLTLLMLMPVTALAAGSIDKNQDVSLTLTYAEKGEPITGADFSIYLVATVDKYGELTITDDFKQFNIDIRGKDDEAWRTVASTMEGYVLRDNITPTDSGKTDINGQLTFPTTNKKLEQGLYLVLGTRHAQNGFYYDATSFMIMLPSQNVATNEWEYIVSAMPKHESEEIPDEPVVITRKVLKKWDDDGHKKDRPKEVVVQLLRDGKVYDTVTLNADNNWRYTWQGLESDYRWTVVEKELKNYSVEVSKEGITFVVTNTYVDDVPEEQNPTNTPKPTLPQTGQLWWPVPVLLCAGLLLLIVGLVRSRRSKTNEK